MALDMLINEAKGMSDDALMEVVHFMQFIKISPERKKESNASEIRANGKKVLRHAGLYLGKITIADDFNAPLDDFKEYME